MFFIRRKKFPTKLFVATGLATFVILASLYFLFTNYFNYESGTKIDNQTIGTEPENHLNLFLKDDVETADPFITPVSRLIDRLDGPIISDFDPSMGAADAQVFVVEFSDFVCNYCQSQEKVLKQLVDKYPNDLRLIWKDMPEIDTDSVSWQASLAGRCAQAQGKFWEYHDLLYANQGSLGQDKFIELAVRLGLNKNEFEKCLADPTTADLLTNNLSEASALSITGIPFIYINNQPVFGEISLEELEEVLQGVLDTL